MKTAISLLDDLFAEAEALARHLETSRRGSVRRGAARVSARQQPDDMTAALHALYGSEPAHLDRALVAAAARILERTE